MKFTEARLISAGARVEITGAILISAGARVEITGAILIYTGARVEFTGAILIYTGVRVKSSLRTSNSSLDLPPLTIRKGKNTDLTPIFRKTT